LHCDVHKNVISLIKQLPQEKTKGDLMNLVVHIHGGGYISGEDIVYGPGYFLDNNDFVYVSINYRLGVLGFASTGDGVLPANNGLKDQVAALKWIQKNIVAFGGNPNSVTLPGMSAGAGSVHYHLISPMSKGMSKYVHLRCYFKRLKIKLIFIVIRRVNQSDSAIYIAYSIFYIKMKCL